MLMADTSILGTPISDADGLESTIVLLSYK